MGSVDAEGQFARRVRIERETRGMSQAELARKLTDTGVTAHPTTIAKIEARGSVSGDKQRSIRFDEAVALASILGISLDDVAETDRVIYPGDYLVLLREGLFEARKDVSAIAARIFALCDRREAHLAVDELRATDLSKYARHTLESIAGLTSSGFRLATSLRLIEINLTQAIDDKPLFESIEEAREHFSE